MLYCKYCKLNKCISKTLINIQVYFGAPDIMYLTTLYFNTRNNIIYTYKRKMFACKNTCACVCLSATSGKFYFM